MPRIGFIGAQGTGKTTLVHALSQEDMFKDYVVLVSPTRYLYNTFGLDHHEGAQAELQLATLYMQLHNTLNYADAFFDRTVIDNYSYLEYYAGRGMTDLSENILNFIQVQTLYLAQKIDYYFILEPEFPLEDDGVRTINVDQQKEIQSRIMDNLQRFEIPVQKLFAISGTVEQRVAAVKRYFMIKEFSGE